MKVLDLFSGIGGFSLGLERAGFKTIAFCEFDKKAQSVLKKNFPNIPIEEDIRFLSSTKYRGVDLICGGFPCQDISIAGKKEGIKHGNRSGLWYEYKRIIQGIQPKYVIIENVGNMLHFGLYGILKELNSLGYNARWDIISAASVGYPHYRKRLWVIAYPNEERFSGFLESYSNSIESIFKKRQSECGFNPSRPFQISNIPESIRMDDGLPGRVDRAKQLGNGLVPDIAQMIGEAIMRFENEKKNN